MQNLPYRTSVQWENINWERVEETVESLQMQISDLYLIDPESAMQAQEKLVHSIEAKALAVKTTVNAAGSNVPGVDRMRWDSNEKKTMVIHRLNQGSYRAKPLKRVYITKVNGKKRALSIPTLYDRAMQTLYKFALTPIAEATSDPHSYGFRRYRTTHDAAAYCQEVLSKDTGKWWILEADINSCFDEIDHDWILAHIPMDKTILRRMLKCGYMERGHHHHTKKGVPQGGPISPVICNMVLDGLEGMLSRKYNALGEEVVFFARYADDFVVMCRKHDWMDMIRSDVSAFLAERGLRLSEEKTRVTTPEEGFDFLGFHIKREQGRVKLLPAQENQWSILSKVESAIANDHGRDATLLIEKLETLLRGWSNYYQYCKAKKTFQDIDGMVANYLEKASCTIKIMRIGKRKPRKYHRIADGCNPHAFEWQHYLEERNTAAVLRRRASHSVLYRTWKAQAGFCPVCMRRITSQTGFSIHGGYVRYSKRAGEMIQQLLHIECHERIHRESPGYLYDSNSFTAK